MWRCGLCFTLCAVFVFFNALRHGRGSAGMRARKPQKMHGPSWDFHGLDGRRDMWIFCGAHSYTHAKACLDFNQTCYDTNMSVGACVLYSG